MDEIDYTDPKLKEAAFILAEKTPRHLDQPTTPPIHWRLEGEILRVLLADGRTVRAPLADQVKAKASPSVKKQAIAPVIAPKIEALPVHMNKKVQGRSK